MSEEKPKPEPKPKPKPFPPVEDVPPTRHRARPGLHSAKKPVVKNATPKKNAAVKKPAAKKAAANMAAPKKSSFVAKKPAAKTTTEPKKAAAKPVRWVLVKKAVIKKPRKTKSEKKYTLQDEGFPSGAWRK